MQRKCEVILYLVCISSMTIHKPRIYNSSIAMSSNISSINMISSQEILYILHEYMITGNCDIQVHLRIAIILSALPCFLFKCHYKWFSFLCLNKSKVIKNNK